MLRRLYFLLGLVCAFFVLAPVQTFACSGYPYFGVDDLPTMELLVRATVIEADDRGFNAVIHVEEYYKGEGPQLLTIVRYPVSLATGRLVRGYDTGCLYAGRGHTWRPGTQGYFGLLSNGDGTFTDANWGTAHFYSWDGKIAYEEGHTEGYALEFDRPLVISEKDFVAKLLEHGERDEPVEPTVDGVLRYPLMRYLMVTTENGTRYQVNPDRSVHELPEDAPISISPDGAHVAYQSDEGGIEFHYIWTDKDSYSESGGIRVDGSDLAFSSDSNLVAIWGDSQLDVYYFHNGSWSWLHGYGTGMGLSHIASVDLTDSGEDSADAIWSSDSTTIAWQDGGGIWRWNLFEEAEPTEVAAASDSELLELIDLSTHGRYLRYREADGWTLVDSQTGERHQNALSSPKEQFLIFVNHETLPIDDWRDTGGCKPPLKANCAIDIGTYESRPLQVFPYQMELLGVTICGPEECYIGGTTWHPSIDDNENGFVGGRYIQDYISDLRQIAYDPFYDQPAILRGDYQIDLAFYDSYLFEQAANLPYLDYLDLESELDSPILEIEWGQPVFYDTFMLTATEYLPRKSLKIEPVQDSQLQDDQLEVASSS